MAAIIHKSARPFIVDVDASFLKRNAHLSKAARNLYGTMRSLADGKTGELSINGNPLDWQYIARQAEIGRYSWLKYLEELRVAGLVQVQRERVMRVIDGRRRVVLGHAHYFVLRQAVSQENSKIGCFLLRSDSSTVQEADPQDSQKHLSFKSGQVTKEKKELSLPLGRVAARSPEHQKENTEEKIRVFNSPDLTRTKNQINETTDSVQKKTKTKDFRPDLTLGSVLGVRQKLFTSREDLRGMQNAEQIWRAAGCPVQRQRLIDVLEKIICESTKTGIGYPAFLLRRKKELQRGDFRPRVHDAPISSAGRWTPPPGSCPKCGDIGFIVRPGGGSGSLCDCAASRRSGAGPNPPLKTVAIGGVV